MKTTTDKPTQNKSRKYTKPQQEYPVIYLQKMEYNIQKTRKNIQHPITLQTPKMEIYKLNQKKVLRIMIMIAESYKRLEIKINS